jgi:dTDP-N-acetylfucosamine:lipid II N-acetylfucosaminyltransferase
MSKSDKIVHICNLDKFIPPFIDFIEEHFDDFETRHVFWVRGDNEKFPYRPRKNIINAPVGRLRSMFSYIKSVNSADKIILHGLFHADQIRLFSVMPWLHKKCYWVIWGGDLYSRQLAKRTLRWRINEVFRRWMIPRIGHLVTHVDGDIERVREWYKAKGQWHECFMYTSNLFKDVPCAPKTDSTINILVGNSADPSNNHLEILDKLQPYKGTDIQIYAPLSYGNQDHAKIVSKYGKNLFSEKFSPLTDFMQAEKYSDFLCSIDIAFFNHKRQQGMGNMVALLGQGKKVYLSSCTSSWCFFKSHGLHTFDINEIDLSPLEKSLSLENSRKIGAYFSESNLVSMLARMFN